VGLHSKSGAIDWDEARRQGDVPGRAGAMRATPKAQYHQTPDVCSIDLERRPWREMEQPSLLDTTPAPVKRGLDPRNPDDEAWDERGYYGAHSDGGD
jgi:hypothetical protein